MFSRYSATLYLAKWNFRINLCSPKGVAPCCMGGRPSYTYYVWGDCQSIEYPLGEILCNGQCVIPYTYKYCENEIGIEGCEDLFNI